MLRGNTYRTVATEVQFREAPSDVCTSTAVL